ncbi:MAG TPA: VanZ family protein, partial [Chitinophagaceae bacterium]
MFQRSLLWLWLLFGWLAVTTVLLCLPGSVLPKAGWFDKIWLDKFIHIGLFGTLCWLCCRTAWLFSKNKSSFLAAVVLCIVYGAVMEFVQKYFIPNRSFEIKDIIAD